MDGDTAFLAHPLIAAVVQEDATTVERRRVHEELANAVESIEERAHHLAVSASEPDERIAFELELAAYSAGARGGYSAVAELAERAAELTPAQQREPGRRRATLAGEVWRQAGRPLEEHEVLGVLAQVEAELGLEREARDHAERLKELAGGLEDLGEIRRGYALVTLGLALERWPEAVAA